MAGSIGDPKRDPGFTGLIALVGVFAGVSLWILTIVLSRSNVSGNGWALSGNGALIIPFGVGPAVVAGGLTALLLLVRGHRRWLPLRIAGSLGGLSPNSRRLLSPIAFPPAGRDAGATASPLFRV